MDINSLLSPQDSPAPGTPPAAALRSPSLQQSPAHRSLRQHPPSRTPSNVGQPTSAYHTPTPPTLQPSVAASLNSRPLHGATSTPPVESHARIASPHDAHQTPPHHLLRQTSLRMETLADLASSMQHQQATSRQGTNTPQATQTQPSSRPSLGSLPSIPRSISGASGVDTIMTDARTFTALALDETSRAAAVEYDQKLVDTSRRDYSSHVGLVTVLHNGFQKLLQDAPSPATGGPVHDARLLDLQSVLRDAYENMAKYYALGEQLWQRRLEDAQATARTLEDHVHVLELYTKATEEEPRSSKIWASYATYCRYLVDVDPSSWREDDRDAAPELFTHGLLAGTLQDGARRVEDDLAEGNLVWDQYLDLLTDDLERAFDAGKLQDVTQAFLARLSKPHATWNETFGRYSSFVSRYNSERYEDIMQTATSHYAKIKEQYEHRRDHEFNLLQAAHGGDVNVEYAAMTEYIEWEKKTLGQFSLATVNGLYERAHLRFPEYAVLWEDHIHFLHKHSNRSIPEPFEDLVQRAVQHCPWSGYLWALRLTTAEKNGKDYEAIEDIKHSATKTGVLGYTDPEGLVQLEMAWCGYLLRRASNATEDQEDKENNFEMAIRSALELVQKSAPKWNDPQYRLARLYIKFHTVRHSPNHDEARSIWKQLTPHHCNETDFWHRYYTFEMVLGNTSHGLQPKEATLVLENALQYLETLDRPEQLIDIYTNHCNHHESVEKLQSATIEQRQAELLVARRRQREAVAQYAAATREHEMRLQEATMRDAPESEHQPQQELMEIDDPSTQTLKRTHDAATYGGAGEIDDTMSEAHSTKSAGREKRDREHALVVVSGLPEDIQLVQIRKFFSEAGTVKDIHFRDVDGRKFALVEFDEPDAADFAIARAESKNRIGDHELSIKPGQGTMLFVSNYPPVTTEQDIRKLFGRFGTILEVRFPSLKLNVTRRFCYIQFASQEEAAAAREMDGQKIGEGDDTGALIAKISDPNARKQRQGATEEGRELFIRHINFAMTAANLREEFGKFGPIEAVKLPIRGDGKNKGFGYVTYKDKKHADMAVTKMHGTKVWGLDLIVEISKPPATKHRGTFVNESGVGGEELAPAPVRERSLYVLDVPDTVNLAQIEQLAKPFKYKRINLLPKKQGAIIELHDVKDMAAARLTIDDFEIMPGRKLRLGSGAELKRSTEEYRPSYNPALSKKHNQPGKQPPQVSNFQPNTTFRKTKFAAMPGRKPDWGSQAEKAAEAGQEPSKTNADFRTMLFGKKD
ncbi:hypothetical protein P154DRAFT_449663 [Amniculicola lignicola CBS 123094]|uniref:RRM domain-containing protein n=1 Tax=Amniculicola lignicola CBS 123094 TaxID=1392246 RepID=A0A6A5VVT4_9PLEO|nr:hypothetical protein P154DRAFT_449663 [Amniculicola lignicola CBS 123094]